VISVFSSSSADAATPTAAAPTAAAKAEWAPVSDKLTLSVKNKLCTGTDGEYKCAILDHDGKAQKCVVSGEKLVCTYDINYVNKNMEGVNCKADGESLVCTFDINSK
jgi:hypothetical protein